MTDPFTRTRFALRRAYAEFSAPAPASPVETREGLTPGICYHGQAMMGVGLHAAQSREPRQIRKEATVSGSLRVP